MQNLCNVIESLFDDDNSALLSRWMTDNVKGNYKSLVLKDGSYRLRGSIIINTDDEQIPDFFIISQLFGDLYIEDCPNLKNINTLLANNAKIEGSINITACPKLETLEGLPRAVDDLSIMDCRSLRSLNGISEAVTGDLNIMKLGRPFKLKDVRKYVKIGPITFNGVDITQLNESEEIYEALGAPAIVNLFNKVNPGFKKQMVDALERWGIKLDTIRPSMITTWKWSDDPKEMKERVKDVRAVLKSCGFVICWNENDCPEWIANDDWQIRLVNQPQHDLTGRYGWDSVVYSKYYKVQTVRLTYSQTSFKQKEERVVARKGMIKPGDEKQYEEIARANIARYKQIIRVNTANRSDKLKEYSDKVSKILNDVAEFIKIASNNIAENLDVLVDLDELNGKIGGKMTYVRALYSKQLQYIREPGLLEVFQQYADSRISIRDKGEAWQIAAATTKQKETAKKLDELIDKIRVELNDLKLKIKK